MPGYRYSRRKAKKKVQNEAHDEECSEEQKFLENNPKVLRFSRQYILNDQDLSQSSDEVNNMVLTFLEDPNIKMLGCRSAMETGKTTLLMKMLQRQQPQKVLCLTHRHISSKKLYPFQELGFINYLDVEGSLQDYDKVIMNVDSIQRLGSDENIREKYEWLIMDEMNDIMMNVKNTHNSDLKFQTLSLLLGFASKVIVLDMDFNEGFRTMFLERCEYRLLYNAYQPYPRNLQMTRNKQLFVKNIIEMIDAGKNIAIMTTTHQKALFISHKLTETRPRIKQYLHTNESNMQLKTNNKDVNTLWNQFQVLIYPMPIIGDADFNIEHFDKIFYFLGRDICDSGYLFRTIFRIRCVRDNNVLCYWQYDDI